MHNDSSFSAEHTYDSAHHSLAALLMARGETFAAGVVAISRYRSYCIDNLDGGQYEVTLEVPAEAYDQARGDLMACLRAACAKARPSRSLAPSPRSGRARRARAC